MAEEKKQETRLTKRQSIMIQMRTNVFEEAYTQTLPVTLRRHMPLDQAINIIGRAMEKTPRIVECEMRTIQQALLDSAALGLELAGPLHEAYIIPYKNRKKGVTEAQMQIGYPGYLKMMRNSGEFDGAPIVQWVRVQDHFEMDIAKRIVSHKPYLDGDRGELKLVYIIAHFKTGGFHIDFKTLADILDHREQYVRKDYNGNWPEPWDDVNEPHAFEEMGRKTMIRLAQKHLPKSTEMARAGEYEGSRDMGKPLHFVEWADLAKDPESSETSPTTSRTASVVERLRAQQEKKDAGTPESMPVSENDEGKEDPTEAEAERSAVPDQAAPKAAQKSETAKKSRGQPQQNNKKERLIQIEQQALRAGISREEMNEWKGEIDIRDGQVRSQSEKRMDTLQARLVAWMGANPQPAPDAPAEQTAAAEKRIVVRVSEQIVAGLLDRIRGLIGWEDDEARQWVERVLEEPIPSMAEVSPEQVGRLEAILDKREESLAEKG